MVSSWMPIIQKKKLKMKSLKGGTIIQKSTVRPLFLPREFDRNRLHHGTMKRLSLIFLN